MNITITNEGYNTRYTVDCPITEDEAWDIQYKSGYHPEGYGLNGFKVLLDGTTTWTRYNNC